MPELLTVAQGYPQNVISRPDDYGTEYSIRLYVAADYATAAPLFPQVQAPETTWGLVSGAVVLSRKISPPSEGSFFTYCDMVCGTPGDYWVAAMEDGGLQKPLEFAPSYLTKWNYHLCMKKGTSAYASFDTATTPSLSEANGLLMRWIKEPSEAPIVPSDEPWKVLTGFQKTKPGVESFITPSPVVREFKRYVTAASAFSASQAYVVGTCYNSTGLISVTGQVWLVMSSGYAFDGLYWNHTVTYQGASSWDVDLYGAPLDQP